MELGVASAVCALRAAALPRKKTHINTLIHTHLHTHSLKDTKLAKRASSNNSNSSSSKKMGEKEKFQLRAVAFN